MENKTKVILGASAAALIASFAAGRWSAPEHIKIETKTVEIEKKSETKDVASDIRKHRRITIVEKIKPDGEKTKITQVTNDSDNKTIDDTIKRDDVAKVENKNEEKTSAASKVTIAALGGFDITTGKMTYGASLSKPVLGPLTLGIFGFNDGRMGCSVGLTF